MEWLASDGGPLVVLPRSILGEWQGVGPDYDLACDVEDYTGVIQKAGPDVLVLNDEPLRTAVMQRGNRTFLVRWRHAPDEAQVLASLETVTDRLAEPVERVSWRVTGSELVIIDAAAGGSEATETLSLRIAPGPCEVVSYLDDPTRELGLLVHELIPDSGTST